MPISFLGTAPLAGACVPLGAPCIRNTGDASHGIARPALAPRA
jgi:hypothetical protein